MDNWEVEAAKQASSACHSLAVALIVTGIFGPLVKFVLDSDTPKGEVLMLYAIGAPFCLVAAMGVVAVGRSILRGVSL